MITRFIHEFGIEDDLKDVLTEYPSIHDDTISSLILSKDIINFTLANEIFRTTYPDVKLMYLNGYGKGLYEQITSHNVHIYDPSKVITLIQHLI
jgi:hypothetical protein